MQTEDKPKYTVLAKQPVESDPYVVADYPYGFRLRTSIRYWVETTKQGQRLVSQTRNPKVSGEYWNKPKKSTYSNIVLVALDENNHVVNLGISMYSLDETKDYLAKYGDCLSAWQKTEITTMIKMLEVYSKVTWTVRTAKFKNMVTGEIMEKVPFDQLADCVEVNDLGDPVDVEAEKNIDRDANRMVNKAAIINAVNSGVDFKDALNTLKRSK